MSRAEMRQQIGAVGSTLVVAQRVAEARERAKARFTGLPWLTNAEVPGFEFRRRCLFPSGVTQPIEDLVSYGRLTQRGADRVSRIAWTVADLGGHDRPTIGDVEEALYLRTKGVHGCSVGAARVA